MRVWLKPLEIGVKRPQRSKCMTEQDKMVKKDAVEKKPEARKKSSKKSAAKASLATPLASLALLLAIASGAGSYYLWSVQQADAVAREKILQDMNARAASLQQGLQASINEQNTKLDARLKIEQLARVELETSIEQLHTELGRDRHAWTLAEVRYYLRLANTRLLLLADVSSALRGLELADARIKALASPSMHKLRGLLNDEISALKTVPKVDLEGASLRLISLVKQVEDLPILAPSRSAAAKSEVAKPTDIKDWRGHLSAIWAEMKTLVTIRKIDRPVDALLAPEQSIFLRHNLRLKLEAARLALLQKDTAVYQASLTEVAEWIAAYFNPDAAVVKALLTQINDLLIIELQPALPDISRSLSEVEKLEKQVVNAQGGK